MIASARNPASAYHFLRAARLLFWGAFLVSLALTTMIHASDPTLATIIRYAPISMLVLALITGIVERSARKRSGLPAKRMFT